MPNYNQNIKREIMKTESFESIKDDKTKEISSGSSKNDHIFIKTENIEDVGVKHEIIEELIIKNEPFLFEDTSQEFNKTSQLLLEEYSSSSDTAIRNVQESSTVDQNFIKANSSNLGGFLASNKDFSSTEFQDVKTSFQKQELERKRKKDAERKRAYRQRQKNSLNVTDGTDSERQKQELERKKQMNAERQRAYRQRQKNNLDVADEKDSEIARQKKLQRSERNKRYKDKLQTKKLEELLETVDNDFFNKRMKFNKSDDVEGNKCDTTQIRQDVPLIEPNYINLSFQVPYLEFYHCAMPNVTLHRDDNIPGDGNCLFHSLIKLMQLPIATSELRRQLLQSPYLNLCTNPENARQILESDFEWGDLDCVFIFSRVYNQNICVHYHYIVKNTMLPNARFCHFEVNHTQNIIHLHLRNRHYTPFFEVTDIIQDDRGLKQEHTRLIENNQHNNFKDECERADSENQEFSDCDNEKQDDSDGDMKVEDETILMYTNYRKHTKGHIAFIKDFKNNTFGHSCRICDRLWWKNDLKKTSKNHEDILHEIIPNYASGEAIDICSTCKGALDKNKIPLMSAFNGFSYPEIPSNLPNLNLIEQIFISPKTPFMQIRRLRHVNGQYGIFGQIINVPIEVDTMVKMLPRNIEGDYCFYVHLKKKLIHKASYVQGLISKNKIKDWLSYLIKTPLYIDNDIKIDNSFFNSDQSSSEINMDDVSEHIPPEDNFTAQQQTLIWDEDKFLHIAPDENRRPLSIFDEYAEELSFPTIYVGQYRKYRKGINVTPFMQAASELRRTDRRATDPQHLLYMAAKIMRLQVSQNISDAFKYYSQDNAITKEKIQSKEYINNCIETNLAFLRCIPNSAWYWSDRKKDLFAMIRQLGSPTAFMTLSANETGWTDLVKLLYTLKNGKDMSDELLENLSYVHKAQLVNEDAVTCAIYFNKLVNCLMNILQSKTRSPFGKHKVNHYFKRIEFQHQGSPHAHILLWLDNTPKYLIGSLDAFIELADELVSVSESEASGNIKLQTHKHTFTCYKKMDPNKKDNCRFGAPFMPSKQTISLIPIKENNESDFCKETFKKYNEHFKLIRTNLENFDYSDFDHFYSHNNIESDEHYYNIICAGINRPKLLYRRTPTEKWHKPFNPFVLHHLKSNMDFQIIPDEYACAAYIVEYVNKHNRSISNLQRQIIEVMDEHPEFNIVEITKKISINILDSVEMPAQEAAWYLLREPMAKASTATVYIPTILPTERQRIRKTMKEINALEDDCIDVSKENWFDKYEKRPEEMEAVTLAQFVSKYYKNKKGIYVEGKSPKIIRYRNYDMADIYNYKREMVLLHIPFRNEENEIIAENKFIQIYADNEALILERRREFESNLDIEEMLELCKQMCREMENEDEESKLQR